MPNPNILYAGPSGYGYTPRNQFMADRREQRAAANPIPSWFTAWRDNPNSYFSGTQTGTGTGYPAAGTPTPTTAPTQQTQQNYWGGLQGLLGSGLFNPSSFAPSQPQQGQQQQIPSWYTGVGSGVGGWSPYASQGYWNRGNLGGWGGFGGSWF